MDDLEKLIIDQIRSHGPITFESFMSMAMYEPGLGYYTSPDTDIGQAADFYTSSNVNFLFGAMIANQVAEMWNLLDKPDDFIFVEHGGGVGLFALDFLEHINKRHSEFYKNLKYIIVELNPSLKSRQKELLKKHSKRVKWVTSIESIKSCTGCIFSNELLDSFPVHLVEFNKFNNNEELSEIYVTEEDGILVEKTGPCSSGMIKDFFVRNKIKRAPGFRTELNLNAEKWIKNVSSILQRGYVITVDYGFNTHDYYSPERSTGTLICYHKHKTNEEPLKRVGHQDITAHVNFSALVEWGGNAGLEPLGFTTQSSFLISNGIDKLITEMHQSLPEEEFLKTAAQVRTLVMPDAMGESHKVLIQGKGVPNKPLRGFSSRNRLGYLVMPT